MKEFGWQGLRFPIPSMWEIGQLAENYLLLVQQGVPVFEARWNRIRGTFDARRQLKRILKQLPASLRKPFQSMALPASWQTATQRFETSAFQWWQNGTYAKGLLLYCRQCKRVLVLQFFSQSPITTTDRSLDTQLLAGLRDHSKDGQTRWAIYDMALSLPESMALQRFRLSPGHFHLRFGDRQRQLRIQRWSTASFILAGKSVQQVAQKLLKIDHSVPYNHPNKTQSFESEELEPVGIGQRIFQQILKKRRSKMTRFWYQAEIDHLFAVQLVARPFQEINDWLDQLCQMLDSPEKTTASGLEKSECLDAGKKMLPR